MTNENLVSAKKAKKDEFYTQLCDIEKELTNYKKYFKNKIILCNCDNPEWSNFYKYFKDNFKELKLKKLIATFYEEEKNTYKIEFDGEQETKTNLNCNGDFRSEECIDILKEADIVCTNPPFSLFKEYVAQLIKYKKKFIILGNLNAVTYKEILPLLKDNKLWLGLTIHSGDREFRVPDDYSLDAAGYRVDENGNKYIRVKGVRWFTNLDHKQRHEKLINNITYNPANYDKYDKYDAINVNKVSLIPDDYMGVMGVPINFIDKYNPDQFEILGKIDSGTIQGLNLANPVINGVNKYKRFAIKRKTDRS